MTPENPTDEARQSQPAPGEAGRVVADDPSRAGPAQDNAPEGDVPRGPDVRPDPDAPAGFQPPPGTRALSIGELLAYHDIAKGALIGLHPVSLLGRVLRMIVDHGSEEDKVLAEDLDGRIRAEMATRGMKPAAPPKPPMAQVRPRPRLIGLNDGGNGVGPFPPRPGPHRR